MNFDYNDYDSRQELFENQNEFHHRYCDNNYRNYEEEYEFRNNNGKINNNIEQYFQQRFLYKDYNKNINPVQNSLSNMSNNFLASDQQNNDKLNSNSIVSRSPIENYNKYDKYENNYNNYYLNENNSITLLNLTDKIYEDDDHLQKGIISKKSFSKGNSGKIKPKKKKSSKLGEGGNNNNNKKKKKSLFIINNKKGNNNHFEDKRNNNLKHRASMVVKHSDNDNFGAFYKIRQKQRKNSALIDIENEKNNYGINVLEESTKKNKFKNLNSNQIKEESSSPNNKGIRLIKSKNSKTIKTNKSKLPLSEPEKEEEEEEEKMSTKKNNIMKIEKVNDEKIQKEEINKIETYTDHKSNKAYKSRIKHCLFCCLKPNLDDSDIK